MKKFKIAILVSGQTRNCTSIANTKLFETVETLFPLDMYDIDYFGHTWNDQVKPDFVEKKFKNFYQSDINDIWNFVKTQNIHKFVPYSWEWESNNSQYKDIKNDPIKFYNLAKSLTIASMAQLWSHLYLAERTMNILKDKYEFYVRLRWDCSIGLHYSKNIEQEIEYFKSATNLWAREYVNYEWHQYNKSNSFILTTTPARLNDTVPWTNDHIYLIKYRKLLSEKTKEKIFAQIAYQSDTMPSSHTLWGTYFNVLAKDNNTLGIHSALPDIIHKCSQKTEFAKKWTI